MPQALTVQDPGHRLVQDACFFKRSNTREQV